MKAILLAALALTSSTAMADFSGNWQGSGELQQPGKQATPCAEMNLSLTHTPQALSVNSGLFQCERTSLRWTPFTVEIRNNQFIVNGQSVGTIDETKLHSYYLNPNNQITVSYDAEINGNAMTYKQTVLNEKGELMYSFTGTFSRH